jgi:hypothetical protein
MIAADLKYGGDLHTSSNPGTNVRKTFPLCAAGIFRNRVAAYLIVSKEIKSIISEKIIDSLVI